MDINERLYVEICPVTGGHAPHPEPIEEGGFDAAFVYKVLGMFNPSETSECYFVLSNPQRQIWFIPQRHLRAFGLIDSDELMLPKQSAQMILADRAEDAARGKAANGNGHAPAASQCRQSFR